MPNDEKYCVSLREKIAAFLAFREDGHGFLCAARHTAEIDTRQDLSGVSCYCFV